MGKAWEAAIGALATLWGRICLAGDRVGPALVRNMWSTWPTRHSGPLLRLSVHALLTSSHALLTPFCDHVSLSEEEAHATMAHRRLAAPLIMLVSRVQTLGGRWWGLIEVPARGYTRAGSCDRLPSALCPLSGPGSSTERCGKPVGADIKAQVRVRRLPGLVRRLGTLVQHCALARAHVPSPSWHVLFVSLMLLVLAVAVRHPDRSRKPPGFPLFLGRTRARLLGHEG